MDSLQKSIYIPPLRPAPRRYYVLDRTKPITPEEQKITLLGKDKEYLGLVNSWLKKLGIEYSVQISSNGIQDIDTYVIDIINAQGLKLTPADVGFGISQVLPVLLDCLSTSRKLIFIEQPEIHLHPKMQTELGDFFISQSKINQFIIESHSEHLLLRIMKRMRQTKLGILEDPSLAITPKDISVLYVESHRGQAMVRNLPLNECGELTKAWPDGFFEEGLREMF